MLSNLSVNFATTYKDIQVDLRFQEIATTCGSTYCILNATELAIIIFGEISCDG